MTVSYEHQQAKLALVVVKGIGRSSFGRNWLGAIRLNWGSIKTVREGTLTKVLARYQAVFEKGPGKLKGHTSFLQGQTSSIRLEEQSRGRT